MSDKLKLGILGTASIAEQIIKAAKMSDIVQIEAIASRHIQKADDWADKFDIPISFGGYEEMLRSSKIDAIYIPLPNSLHTPWIIRSLEAGFPVLSEKPLCINLIEAREIAEASAKFSLPVVEGFMYFHHPMYEQILKLIRQGAIGDLSTISSRFSWMCDDRSEIPASADLGGGSLFDVGCYCVHLSRQLAQVEPSRVFAFERRSEVDDTLLGMLDFPNGVIAQFETSIANFERHGVEITGTRGQIIIEQPWIQNSESCKFMLKRENKEDKVFDAGNFNTYKLELEAFARIVWENSGYSKLVEDSVNNLVVIDALFQSAKTGKAVAT